MSEVADKRIEWPVEMFSDLPQWQSSRMLCEVLLSSLWFLFVIFWVETISVWLFLSMFYQDRAFYHWGDGVFAYDPGQMIYMLSRVDTHMQTEMQT